MTPTATADPPADIARRRRSKSADPPAEPASQAEREASAEHDGGTNDPPAPKPEVVAQVDFDGNQWEAVVGGNLPSETKVRILGGAVSPSNLPDGGIKKGRRYVLRVEVEASGYAADDTHDDKSQQVTGTVETRKLKIRSARFVS